MNDLDVAVIIPAYKEELTYQEQQSLRHLYNFLGNYHIYWVIPENISLHFGDFSVKKFHPSYFSSIYTYNHLTMSSCFYETFAKYKYILIYQLDALVHSDQLAFWCEQDYDYIGAPVFNVHRDCNSGFSGILNGGFSLRRVSSFLEVLHSTQKIVRPNWFFNNHFANHKLFFRLINLHNKFRRKRDKNCRQFMQNYLINEDIFWSIDAKEFLPAFKVAPPEIALRFSFEWNPSFCYKLNQKKLPFGCHAWHNLAPAFWQPFLIQQTVPPRLSGGT